MKTPKKENNKAAALPEKKVATTVEHSSPAPSKRMTRSKTADENSLKTVSKSAERRVRKSSSAAKAVSVDNAAETKPLKTARAKRSVAAKNLADELVTTSSPVKRKRQVKKPVEAKAVAESVGTLETLSRVDMLLAQPELPPLERENRARLQMQTPTRLYFYWSVRRDPWAMLRKAFDNDTGGYTLVLKLVELRSGTEQIYNADAEGNWWFDVRPDGEYQAEIGFYAPNRPYFRIVYSNIIETPRKKPSPRKAVEADWMVTADRFARVLNVAGFTKDAVHVAIAGDEPEASATAARSALQQFTGGNGISSLGSRMRTSDMGCWRWRRGKSLTTCVGRSARSCLPIFRRAAEVSRAKARRPGKLFRNIST